MPWEPGAGRGSPHAPALRQDSGGDGEDSRQSAIPLTAWAERRLGQFATLAGAPGLGSLSAAALLGERAALNGFRVPGRVSAGGGCRLFDAHTGHVALNLARPDDRTLLPALFGDVAVRVDADEALAACITRHHAADLVARGRELGLALASLAELPANPACVLAHPGLPALTRARRPLVIDLSALWAGPLAGHLLALAGAEVVKVESRNRPDSMREGDPALFARLNGGKHAVGLDLRDGADRDALLALLRRADLVIEAARPRALRQLGIDAESLVGEIPGLVWVTITGHGASGQAAEWVGFGDDCGVAGGLSAALLEATGQVGFVGDALADPLTGIAAAGAGLARWRSGTGGRLVLSMAGVVAAALAEEVSRDPNELTRGLRGWALAQGQPFPPVAHREPLGPVRPFGADTAAWLASCPPC